MFRRDAKLQDGQLARMNIGSTIVPRANLGTYARATYIIHIGIKQPFWWWGEKERKQGRKEGRENGRRSWERSAQGKSELIEESIGSVNNRKRTRLFQICVYRYNNNISLTSPSKSSDLQMLYAFAKSLPADRRIRAPGNRRSIVRIDSSISRRKPSWSQRAAIFSFSSWSRVRDACNSIFPCNSYRRRLTKRSPISE